MIVVIKSSATPQQTQMVVDKIVAMGYGVNVSQGSERLIIGVLGVRENKDMLAAQLGGFDFVERVVPVSKSYKLVSREGTHADTVVRLSNGVEIGGNAIHVMAGAWAGRGRGAGVEKAAWGGR